MCVNLKIFNCTKWFFVKYIFLFLWTVSLFLVFCKSYKFYYDEPEYERLKNILGHGLCISRGTAPILYVLVVISILPVCRTFNQIIHCILRRISTFCLTLYLEKIKVIHMTFSIGLVLVSVIHTVAHIINARNFVQFYDWQHLDLNWASGTNDSYLRLIFATPTGFSGCFMLFALIVMWISSTRPIRHYYFNCYLALHHLFMLMVLVLLYFHTLGEIGICSKEYVRNLCIIHWTGTFGQYKVNLLLDSNEQTANVIEILTKLNELIFMLSLLNVNKIRPTDILSKLVTVGTIFQFSFHLFIVSNIIKFQTNVDFPCAHDVNATDETCHNKEQFSAGARRGWIWPTIGLFIYLADAFVRFIRRNANDIVVHNIQKCPGKAVFLRLGLNKSTLAIRPGQYILLQCLNISSLEWHPFTVTKVPTRTDHTFTLLIATRGDWTMELYGKVSSSLCFQKNQSICKTYHVRPQLKFLVDGPFPSPLESVFQHKITVCVAGGVGVTPFISVLNELLHKLRKEPSRMHLTWVVTHVEQILWFSSIFEQLMEKLWQQNAPDRLDIQLYVTKNFNVQKIAKIFNQESSFVKSRIHSGRPNWCSLFTYLDFLYQKQDVAVFCSGPKSLNAEIQKMCHEKNKIGYNYWFLHQGFY